MKFQLECFRSGRHLGGRFIFIKVTSETNPGYKNKTKKTITSKNQIKTLNLKNESEEPVFYCVTKLRITIQKWNLNCKSNFDVPFTTTLYYITCEGIFDVLLVSLGRFIDIFSFFQGLLAGLKKSKCILTAMQTFLMCDLKLMCKLLFSMCIVKFFIITN